jgi:hypothetical protein
MLEKVAQLFCGIALIFMGSQAFFERGYRSVLWGRYIDYGPYHQVIGLIFVIGGFFILGFALYSRRKSRFRSIKKKYGIVNDNPYNIESITRLLLRFNQMVETPLGCDGYAVIRLDGAPLLLLYGNVAFTGSRWVGITNSFRTAIYLIVEDDEASKIVQKHQDLFELAIQKKNTTLF